MAHKRAKRAQQSKARGSGKIITLPDPRALSVKLEHLGKITWHRSTEAAKIFAEGKRRGAFTVTDTVTGATITGHANKFHVRAHVGWAIKTEDTSAANPNGRMIIDQRTRWASFDSLKIGAQVTMNGRRETFAHVYGQPGSATHMAYAPAYIGQYEVIKNRAGAIVHTEYTFDRIERGIAKELKNVNAGAIPQSELEAFLDYDLKSDGARFERIGLANGGVWLCKRRELSHVERVLLAIRIARQNVQHTEDKAFDSQLSRVARERGQNTLAMVRWATGTRYFKRAHDRQFHIARIHRNLTGNQSRLLLSA